jgi:predicted metal-dependent hydrolase
VSRRLSKNLRVQFDLNLFRPKAAPEELRAETVMIGGRSVLMSFVRNVRARRYLLRVSPDGKARVTVPRRGSFVEAKAFALRHVSWIERQLQRLAERPSPDWSIGTEIFLRGEKVTIEKGSGSNELRFGTETVSLKAEVAEFRREIERHLWQLAIRELVPKVWELAKVHGVSVTRVTVRNQRSRWGSCSRRGTISLNWRLIQTPSFVQEYLILHELMHMREMNHSARFWHQVESVCPAYRDAEKWLKDHSRLLR